MNGAIKSFQPVSGLNDRAAMIFQSQTQPFPVAGIFVNDQDVQLLFSELTVCGGVRGTICIYNWDIDMILANFGWVSIMTQWDFCAENYMDVLVAERVGSYRFLCIVFFVLTSQRC